MVKFPFLLDDEDRQTVLHKALSPVRVMVVSLTASAVSPLAAAAQIRNCGQPGPFWSVPVTLGEGMPLRGWCSLAQEASLHFSFNVFIN